MDNVVVLDNEFSIGPDHKPIIPDDLITLTHLHEPVVVYCLQQRYNQDQIYTNTGQVLLALNPFVAIRGLYGESMMRKYSENKYHGSSTKLPPHVYQIADASFRSMKRVLEQNLGNTTGAAAAAAPVGGSGSSRANQSILVSGESGAGKTVTTKYVMKYLAALSTRSATVAPTKRAYQMVAEARNSPPKSFNKPIEQTHETLLMSSNSIESQVLQSNPILESFGNARTVRNDNSSRFGKFIEIQFTQSGQLVGATIDVYLLEKVRLLTQAEGERNYHVYYELLSGAMSARELRQFYLAPTAGPEDFLMTQSGTYDRRDGVTDKETYKALKVAMNSMGFSAEEQMQIFALTAALLHASNLELKEMGDGQSSLSMDNVHLEPVCMLLGVTPENLDAALCTFSIQAGRGEAVRRSQSKSKAEKGLQAIIKATYGALFTYLVRRINDSIAYKKPPPADDDDEKAADLSSLSSPAATIGVLDIFGFESFTTNSFEQLCINYCNEALQQQFNAFVLKNEQDEYEREGIDWSFIEFPENQDVLDLIDKRGSGILNILDDQCRAPGTSDKSFASDMYNKCNGHVRFRANRKQVALSQFEVHHYAGPVEYTTFGFVEKNRDELPKEATELLRTSENPFIQHLAEILTGPSPAEAQVEGSGLASFPFRRSDSSVVNSVTVGGQFRRQLKDLRSKIDQTSPHYVRCLKPNDHLVPNHFDPLIVAEQLKCGGILEAVRVSRAGYTQHYPHADFVRRYRCLAVKELKKNETARASRGAAAGPIWGAAVATPKKWTAPRNGAFQRTSPQVVAGSSSPATAADQNVIDPKAVCTDLLKVIYNKLQAFELDESKENIPEESPKNEAPAAAKAKSYEYKVSTPPPSWSKSTNSSLDAPRGGGLPPSPKSVPVKSRYQPWTKPQQELPPPPPVPVYRSSIRSAASSTDFAKAGIQMGKTKVFLRHKAFETLERIRSRHLGMNATKLHAVFRMYLARMAYVPIRDAYRQERRGRELFFNAAASSKEHKEEDHSNRTIKRSNSGISTLNLIEQFESQFRLSFHNPSFLRGKNDASGSDNAAPVKNFKWMLLEGLWVKNPVYVQPWEENFGWYKGMDM